MIISCQACSTRYLIEPSVLGPKRRLVRCAKCGHSWQQEPPADMPLQVDADAPPPGLVDLPVTAVRRRRGRGLALPLLVLILLLGGLGAGYIFRDRIVARWPQAAQIYELANLPVRHGDGLELDNISYTLRDNVVQLQGEIFNPTAGEVGMPHLKASLRDTSGRLLLQWTFDIDRRSIRPGETIAFKAEHNAPDTATELGIDFAAKD
jgi:predicted Zn finger-like uncharacterized protein